MRICILDSSYEQTNSIFKDVDIPAVPERYLAGHTCEHHFLHKATAVQEVFRLAKQGFDLFVNLCDGEWDEDRAGIEVVQALERLGVPFTGATSDFFAVNRVKTKMACHAWGVKTPASVFVYDEPGIALAARNLCYPMLVKHYNGYGSIGLTRDSRVTTEQALYTQTRLMLDTYKGVLVEEFIDGREFTVLVAENPDDANEPIAYQPVEFSFPPGESFKHFAMKWEAYVDMNCTPVTDADLIVQLKEMSQKTFVAVSGVSYGRCDIRMNAHGELFLLEINPNCGVFYPPEARGSADWILAYDERGHSHFVDMILCTALKRGQQARPKWQLLLNSRQHYGMYATQPIAAGEVIEPFEDQPHVLVSKRYAQQNWSAQQKTWFAHYAYPLTDEIYVTWSHNPEEWKPINHACNPNAWLEGLNLVARRPIQSGEEITVDYSTFCGDEMASFTCTCGDPACRGVIRGRDYLQPFVAQYGDHVSDYVRTKRKASQDGTLL